ncbi:MAG TPA: carbon monoxide dehydrogenase subunit G [Candidatus Baltobacteraceae bacterium]|nr:carbon monoxide dehydrogenase subunit G [Candidatus Baltobacteraceae bacterium]
MRFEGTERVAATQPKVWAFLMDPQQVGTCGPGVESIEPVDATHFKARATVGVGFIKARFVVDMEMADLHEPDAATMKAHGQAPGSAVDAAATMQLTPDGADATNLAWAADVNISGTLASVGARLIQGTAEKMIRQTFDCIRTKLEA